jgi:8-amino-7-oxononanoate synthase
MSESTTPPAHRAWLKRLEEQAAHRHAQGLQRELRPIDSACEPHIRLGGRTFLQFCSNNYLGLATHPAIIEAGREATSRFGTGAGASRLVAGSMALHHQLEAALAALKKCAAALLFPTGYMANLALLTTFAGEGDLVVSDKLNHASLLDAARFSGAHCRTFPHRHYRRAADLLARGDAGGPAPAHREPARFLVTDALFSMDGDIADLPAACDLADRHQALVVIDDAHGTGVLGPRGAGLAELQQVEQRIALTVGTLSKALGSVGGFIAGPRAAIDALINTARSFIYTTALPPACSAAALAALRIVEEEPQRRARVLALASSLRNELRAMGYDCGDSASPIIPVILGESSAALRASEFLKQRGIFVPAIRPPTVPPGSARLRISLMATHEDGQIAQFLAALRELRKDLPAHSPLEKETAEP